MDDTGEGSASSLEALPDFYFMSDRDLSIPSVDVVTYALARLGRHDPKQVIYVDAENPSDRILAGEVKSKVACLSAWLKLQGLEAGDCVCIHTYNSIWYPLFWLATLAAGGIVTGSNPAYTASELTHHFVNTNTSFVVTHELCVPTVTEAVSVCGISADKVFVLGKNGNTPVERGPTFWDSGHWEEHYDTSFDDKLKQDATIAVYAATSGTTGLPKAAEISHKYLVAQATLVEHLFSGRHEEVRQLISLPIFHAFAAQLSIVLPLRLGITTYFMPRFNLSEYLHYVDRFQITDSAVVPPIVSALLAAPPGSLRSIRYMICAGAPMTTSVQTRLYSNLDPSATIAQCWGTTELGWHTVFNRIERDVTGSVGRLLPNTLLKIVDGHGLAVTNDNVSGEALVMSSSMFKGYRNVNSTSAALFDAEGFYRTGDRVFMRHGKVYICGREKDIMKVNGWQVSPEELEQVIKEIDGVADCGVVGHMAADPNGLEQTQPRAFIVRTAGSKVTREMVHAHVNRQLIRYKRLTGGIVFIDMIPRTNTGKILRVFLAARRDQAEDPVIADRIDQTRKAAGIWEQQLLAVVLIPLCFGLGLPGVILLALALKSVGLGKSGKRGDA